MTIASLDNLVALKEVTVGLRGSRNLIVSIPISWVRTNKVKAGDKVRIMQAPGSSDLVIRHVTNGKGRRG